MVAQDGGLYLGTANHGVWFADPDGTTTSDEPAAVPLQPVLGRPHPNPSTVSATLPLSWPRTESVRVDLYDILGRRVMTLLDGEVRAGETVRVQVVTNGLPPGHYLVQATGDGHRVSQRLTVTR